MHVCMGCYEIYDSRFLKHGDTYQELVCPKINCDGDVIRLDEMIGETIITLNKKGYLTKYCCAGHWYNDALFPYIYFHDDFLPEAIPESFDVEEDYHGNKTTIRARYDMDSDESKYDFVIRINKELHDWAESLPEVEW